MLLRTLWRATTLTACMAAIAKPASASVVLGGTRVIYPAAEREITLRLGNEGADPALVQAWIDDGDASAIPDDASVPFMAMPPLFRLDPGKGQTLRIVHTGEPIPRERESLFWLNVLQVPPASDTEGTNSLQLAFRSRIKMFYRPDGLPGDAAAAPAAVTWQFVRDVNGHHALAATNPTPYHVTFSRIAVRSGHTSHQSEAGAMVAPGATAVIDIGAATEIVNPSPDRVDYTFVNDYGAGVDGTRDNADKQ